MISRVRARPIAPWARAIALALVAVLVVGSGRATAAQPDALTKSEIKKFDAERRKAQDDDSPAVRAIGLGAPILTALIAAGGLWVSVWKLTSDRRQAEQEASLRRFDERFSAAVTAVASETTPAQRAGAVLLDSMVREPTAALSDQAINLLLALLQGDSSAQRDETATRLLVKALERAIRGRSQALSPDLSLTRICAPGLNLGGLDLTNIDLAYAEAEDADFRNATLERSRGFAFRAEGGQFQGAKLGLAEWVDAALPKADFEDARLTRIRLRRGDLRRADFHRAQLRDADLRETDLRGARFHSANLVGARFYGARIDETAMQSIVAATGWREAQFDESVRKQLVKLSTPRPADAGSGRRAL